MQRKYNFLNIQLFNHSLPLIFQLKKVSLRASWNHPPFVWKHLSTPLIVSKVFDLNRVTLYTGIVHALSTFSRDLWLSLPRPRIISFRRCDPWKSNTLAPVAATARPTRQLRVRSTQLWKSLRRVGSSPPAPLYHRPVSLPVVESCSKSIAKSRYIASTVITRKIAFTGRGQIISKHSDCSRYTVAFRHFHPPSSLWLQFERRVSI